MHHNSEWNGKNDTLEWLDSVKKIDYPNFDVVVVDNRSNDDSVTAIQKTFPKITIVEPDSNLGIGSYLRGWTKLTI